MIIIRTISGHDFKYKGRIKLTTDEDGMLYIMSEQINKDADVVVLDKFFFEDVESVRGDDDLLNSRKL